MHFLKSHPFPVEAHFEKSLVITFAVPKEDLQDLLPYPLELDTFEDKWGFVAVAMVQTQDLRPKGFPKFMGNDFFLIGYRIFVKYRNLSGKRLRGLYILKSETNRKKMQRMGNLFTRYQYTTTDISFSYSNEKTTIQSKKSNFSITTSSESEKIVLPPQSPFQNWKEARRFAGPLPFTFSVDQPKQKIIIIEGVRKNWGPIPVEVLDCTIGFLEQSKFKNAILASAFEIKNIPYYWKKGKIEKWV